MPFDFIGRKKIRKKDCLGKIDLRLAYILFFFQKFKLFLENQKINKSEEKKLENLENLVLYSHVFQKLAKIFRRRA